MPVSVVAVIYEPAPSTRVRVQYSDRSELEFPHLQNLKHLQRERTNCEQEELMKEWVKGNPAADRPADIIGKEISKTLTTVQKGKP